MSTESSAVPLIIVSGAVVMVGRYWIEIKMAKGARAHALANPVEVDRTIVRSWIAISLVGGLLVFCAVAFALKDETSCSALVGGLVANAGAAVVFLLLGKEC